MITTYGKVEYDKYERVFLNLGPDFTLLQDMKEVLRTRKMKIHVSPYDKGKCIVVMYLDLYDKMASSQQRRM